MFHWLAANQISINAVVHNIYIAEILMGIKFGGSEKDCQTTKSLAIRVYRVYNYILSFCVESLK